MLKTALKLALVVSVLAVTHTPAAHAVPKETYEKLDIFAHVLDRIRSSYVHEVTESEVIENAINGMLTALDPHSGYLDLKDMAEMNEQTRGEFGGLGIEVTMDKGVVKVVAPIEDTPADRAGMQAGDLIIEIDGEQVQGQTLSEAVDKMRGEVGTKIELKVYREDENETLDITIVRDIIKITPVKSELKDGGIGYLRLTTFNEHLDEGLKEHYKKLVDENGGPLNGLVLDLRNNPGGLLTQAIAVSDAFLNEGEVVSTRGRIEGQDMRYNAHEGDISNGLPIVVLINSGSASASEIVAGALQDHKRAVIVGTKSFGKGSVQTIMRLPGETGMRLTTALYYTPSGRSIQAKGIEPDIVVRPLKVEEIETDGIFSEARYTGHLGNPDEEKNGTDKDKKDAKKDKNNNDKGGDNDGDKKDDNDEAKKPQDYQLLRALDIVRALAIWQTADAE